MAWCLQEGEEKKIRMGNLAIVGANKVNGVAAIHTEIIKKDTFVGHPGCCISEVLSGFIVGST